jgi:eukaryotic-like serine/threonine-protein kinase
VGRYDIVGHLAAGGMAESLLGRIVGPSGFQRPVVIKRILPHLAREKSFTEMFLDEARIVAGIRHPNVVQVHELGHENDELFLVMEYLEGESLSGLIKRLRAHQESLEYPLAAYILAEACAGLHAAHELADPQGVKQNVVHRDVSPQNVFVSYAGGVKVLDFGIAVAADRVTRTEAGTFKGKFEYGSPEQCRGKPLDRRSDVFALGILLFELSTGTRLFKRGGQLDTLRAICEEPILPPTKVIVGYPEELSRIVMKALERDKDLRYPTALAMRRDLLAAMRELTTDIAPEERLASIMQRLFADRVAEKGEMLRRVEAGSNVEHLPTVETDNSIDIPVATAEMPSLPPAAATRTLPLAVPLAVGEYDPAIHPPSARRGASAGLIAAGTLGALGLVVALWLATRTTPPPAAATTVTQAEPSAASTPAPPPSASASAPVAAAEVILRVETVPPKAHVRIGGHDHGASPIDVRVPRGTEALDVEIKRDGYRTLHESVVPEMDQKLKLTLVPNAATPASAPKSSAGAYHRFD